MRIKFNKDIEFLLKRIFVSEKFLLQKRLERSIKKAYEEELLILKNIASKDLESVDVGVYRGVYTYQLSKLTKHVHSFEPNPLIFPYLNRNLKKIVKNVTIYNNALSDKVTEVDLKIPKRFNTMSKENYEEKYKMGCATIHKNNLLSNEEYVTFRVKTTTLDTILINNKIGFIKIDAEGHEKNILIGGLNLIKKNKPNLLVEIEERHTKENVENTINFIRNLGYKSYFLKDKKIVSTEELKGSKNKNNYIFLSN